MSILLLILTWALLGIIVGALALAARFKPTAWGRYGWLWMLGLGFGSSLLGGLLGFWLVGRLFSAAFALWVAVMGTCGPSLVGSLMARLTRKQT